MYNRILTLFTSSLILGVAFLLVSCDPGLRTETVSSSFPAWLKDDMTEGEFILHAKHEFGEPIAVEPTGAMGVHHTYLMPDGNHLLVWVMYPGWPDNKDKDLTKRYVASARIIMESERNRVFGNTIDIGVFKEE